MNKNATFLTFYLLDIQAFSNSETLDINIWSNSLQNLVRTLKGHSGNGRITNLILSTDERYLFSTSSSDNDIIVWDWKSGTQVRRLSSNQNSFNSLNISSDNNFLIGGNASGQIKIWRVDNGILSKSFTIPNPVLSISLTNGDKFIALKVQNNNGSNSFSLLDATNGSEVWRLQNGNIHGVAINSIGTEIWLSGSKNNASFQSSPYLEVYNISEKKLMKSFGEYFSGNDFPYSIKINSTNNFLQAGQSFFDAHNKTWIRRNNNHYHYGVDYCHISSGNKYVVTGSWNGSIALSTFDTGLKLNIQSGKHPMKVWNGLLSQNEKNIITQDFAGIKEWNISTGSVRNITNLNGTYNLALMSDGIWHRSCSLNKISIQNGSEIGYSNVNFCNALLSSSKNEKYMAIQNSNEGGISIFDPSSGKLLNTLTGHSNNLLSLEFTGDSRYLISASLDKTVKIWDTFTGALLKTITFSNPLNSVKINPDDKTITINETFATKTYAVPTGLQISSLPITKYLNKMAISPNSKTLAGVSNSTLYIFDNSTGALKKEKTYNSSIRNIYFHSSGTQLFIITEKEFEVLNIQ